jgi:hypothetical protein
MPLRIETIEPDPEVYVASAFAPSVTFHPSTPAPEAIDPDAYAPEATPPEAIVTAPPPPPPDAVQRVPVVSMVNGCGLPAEYVILPQEATTLALTVVCAIALPTQSNAPRVASDNTILFILSSL